MCDEMVQHITDVTEGKRRGGEGRVVCDEMARGRDEQ